MGYELVNSKTVEKQLSTSQLSCLTDLFNEKEKYLNVLLNSLQLEDISKEKLISDNLTDIKNFILLKPIRFKEPNVYPVQYFLSKLPSNEAILNGNGHEIGIVPVEFPIEGSTELFGYSIDGYCRSKHINIYMPELDGVFVLVERKNKNDEIIKQEASNKMKVTFELFDLINPVVITWSDNMNKEIDKRMQIKINNIKNSCVKSQ